MTNPTDTRRPLTARGIKLMLTRARVSHLLLTITDDPAVWVDVETGSASTSVKIEGPKEVRRAAAGVLFAKGLTNAPYPEYDMWSRP